MYDYLIAGAGYAGCVLAERLATQRDKKVLLIDRRAHIGGNAYDSYNERGILIHNYGPHLFHTNDRKVFDYLSQFTEWRPYEHRVLAMSGGKLYTFPVNRATLNQAFALDLQTPEEAELFFASQRENLPAIRNSEDIIVSQVGRTLFEKFFRGYTKKQWKREPRDLSPGVCGRIPVRSDLDDRYFTDQYQYIPLQGYTAMFEKMTAHKNIEVALNTDFRAIESSLQFQSLIYTGPIDQFFDCVHGSLPYRSIDFRHETIEAERYQPAAQINYCDESIPYTRVNEWKYITGQTHAATSITREFPTTSGEPLYPIPSDENHELFRKYREMAEGLNAVHFIGRLAEYRYYNMDQVTARALHYFETVLAQS